MALRVPPQYLPKIQGLLELPDERVQGLLDALAKSGSKFNTNDLAVDVSKRTKVPRPLTEGIVNIIATFYKIREDQNIPLETFVDEQVGSCAEERMDCPSRQDQVPR